MKYLVVFGIIAAMFVGGQCLKCFECEGDKCVDGKSLKDAKNCTSEEVCYKQINFDSVEKKADKAVYKRGCLKPEKFFENFNFTKTPVTEAYYCKTDECNGVGSFTASLSIVLVTLIAMMFASDRW